MNDLERGLELQRQLEVGTLRRRWKFLVLLAFSASLIIFFAILAFRGVSKLGEEALAAGGQGDNAEARVADLAGKYQRLRLAVLEAARVEGLLEAEGLLEEEQLARGLALPPVELLEGLLSSCAKGKGLANCRDDSVQCPGEDNPKVKFVIYFVLSSADMTPTKRQQAARAAQVVRDCGSNRIAVSGHTDRSGGERMNQELSYERAWSVRRELEDALAGAKGLNWDVDGFGESRPIVETEDGVAEERNRRVEIVVN